MTVAEAIGGRAGSGKRAGEGWNFPRSLLVQNTFSLYGVQIGRKLLPLASLPYLARVLGPGAWGEVFFVSSLAELVVIAIEFGFGISATRQIARQRHDRAACARIASSVLGAQVLLALAGLALAGAVSRSVPLLVAHPELLACGLVYAVVQGFVPLWYFQGTERIRTGAALEMGGKILALLLLLVTVHGPGDAWRALLIQAVGPGVSTTLGLCLLARAGGLLLPRWAEVREALADSWQLFLFRSGESLYGVANAFLLGLYVPPALVGFFSSAEKISKAAAGLLNPIRDSLYPRISFLVGRDEEQSRRLMRLGARLMIGGGLALSCGLWLGARPAIGLLLGASFEPAVAVLRIFAPLPLILSLTFSAGQLVLLPLRLDRAMTHAIFGGALLNIVLSYLLAPRWGHIGMAWTVLLAEAAVALSLVWTWARCGLPGSSSPKPGEASEHRWPAAGTPEEGSGNQA